MRYLVALHARMEWVYNFEYKNEFGSDDQVLELKYLKVNTFGSKRFWE